MHLHAPQQSLLLATPCTTTTALSAYCAPPTTTTTPPSCSIRRHSCSPAAPYTPTTTHCHTTVALVRCSSHHHGCPPLRLPTPPQLPSLAIPHTATPTLSGCSTHNNCSFYHKCSLYLIRMPPRPFSIATPAFCGAARHPVPSTEISRHASAPANSPLAPQLLLFPPFLRPHSHVRYPLASSIFPPIFPPMTPPS